MHRTPFYILPIKKVARFGEDFLSLEQFKGLPYRLRSVVSKAFWGGHVIFLILIFLEGPFGYKQIGVAEYGIYLFAPFWAIYFANFLFVYLPFAGFYEVFSYLSGHHIPPITAFLITTLTFIGIAAMVVIYIAA